MNYLEGEKKGKRETGEEEGEKVREKKERGRGKERQTGCGTKNNSPHYRDFGD